MITIHEAKAADFTTLGLGALLPTECTVSEMAGGMYELKIVHPITGDMRHDRIKPMRIIKAPAPVRETPRVEIGQSGTVMREIYQVATGDMRLNLRASASMDGKIIHAYRPGTEVCKLSVSGDWMQVAVLDGGASGWMWAENLEFVRTETEQIQNDTPGSVIQPRQTREQLFRIYRYSPDTKTRTVTAEAQHITYDLVGAIVDGEYNPENVPADRVCAQIMARADHDISDFHIYCTITDPVSGEYGGRNILDCLLDPETGVVAQTKARVIRDNYDIYILPDETRSRGVELRYGKNLLAAYMDADTSDTVTRIKPVGKDKNGEKLYIEENGGWVESPYIGDYPVIKSREVEYDVVESDELPIDQARALLRERAEADFAAGCDMTTVTLDADFVRLELTEDYKHLANAYALHLYDSVPVIDREADIVATARMTKYTYDAILDEYQDTGLGELNDVKSTIYGYEIAQGTVSGGKLIPNTVNGDRLQNLSVSYGKFDLAAIKHLSADAITAIRADIRELVAGNITTDQLYADLAVIAAAQITAANIDKANIKWAEIESLTAEIAKVVNAEIGKAVIDSAQIKNLTAVIAVIAKAEIEEASIDWAQIKNAEIDTAQIKLGAITRALIAAGAIGTAQIADGSITSAKIVELTADLIKAGTLSAERLLIKGAGGLFYEINAKAGGLTSTQLTQEQYKNAISGTALVTRSVTADKIAAKSITSNEILSGTITAAEINVANLFAAEATIAALDSYIMRTSTIEALKGSLNIWASEKINLAVSQVQVGGRNLLRMTDDRIYVVSGGVSHDWAANPWFKSRTGITLSPFDSGWNGVVFLTDVSMRHSSAQPGNYVLSFWAWVSQGWTPAQSGAKPVLTANYYYEQPFIDTGFGSVELAENRPIRFEIPVQVAYNGPVCIRLLCFVPFSAGYIHISDVKFEEGTKATDWSPAPEDTDDAIGKVHAELTVKADNINQRVTNEVKGLQTQIDLTDEQVLILAGKTVGGVNLLKLGDVSFGNSAGTLTGALEERSEAHYCRSRKVMRLFAFSGNYNAGQYDDIQLAAGKQYTVSFWAATGVDGQQLWVNIWNYGRSVDINLGDVISTATNGGYYTRTFTCTVTDTYALRFINFNGHTSQIMIMDAKLEEGNTATAWSPNPEEFRTGSSVEITEKRVKISSPETLIAIPSEDGERMIAQFDENGVTAERVHAGNVAYRYDGAAMLYVNPNATGAQVAAGNYFRSLADACAAVSGRNLDREVTINVQGDSYGTAAIYGVCGRGSLTVLGSGRMLTGQLLIGRNTADIVVNGLTSTATGAAAAIQQGPGWVQWTRCKFIGNSSGGSSGLFIDRHAAAFMFECELYNAEHLLSVGKNSDVVCNMLKGGGGTNFLYGDGGNVKWYGTRPDGSLRTDHPALYAPGDLAALAIDYGTAQPSAPAIQTTEYNYLYSDSYRSGWQWFSDDDIRQGYDGGVIYGVIWFDAAAIRSALNGKTINQVSLRLYMAKGVGRGVNVNVELYGSNVSYDRTAAPELTASYGSIGETQPDMINEITIPAQAVRDMISGAVNALVIKSSDSELHKDRPYSRNYARFAGSTTATADNCPRLTVVYQ